MTTSTISTTKKVKASGDDLFAYLLRVTEYQHWLTGIQSSTLEHGTEGELGSQYRFGVGVLAFSDSLSLELRELDVEQRRIRFEKPQPRNPIALELQVHSAQEPCEVTVQLEHPWSGRVLGFNVQGRLFKIFLSGLLDQSAPKLVERVRAASEPEAS